MFNAPVRFVVEVPADPGRHERLVRVVLGRQLLAYRLLGILLVALGAWTLTSDNPHIGVMELAGGLVMLIMPTLILRAARRNAQATDGPWTYTVGDAGIALQSPVMRNELAWAAFTKARITDTDIVLFVARNNVVGIPRAALDPDRERLLMWLLHAHGLLAGDAGRVKH